MDKTWFKVAEGKGPFPMDMKKYCVLLVSIKLIQSTYKLTPKGEGCQPPLQYVLILICLHSVKLSNKDINISRKVPPLADMYSVHNKIKGINHTHGCQFSVTRLARDKRPMEFWLLSCLGRSAILILAAAAAGFPRFVRVSQVEHARCI